MDKITLDREVFKVLASDTRLDILKALDVRQKTVTELARELELNKATVFEHLEKLNVVGLVQKLEDDRKWVYWQLSWKGRRLLHPDRMAFAVLLSSAVGSLATAAVAFWLWLQSGVSQFAADGGGDDAPNAGAQAESMPMAAPAPRADTAAEAAAADPMLLWIAIALAVVFLALASAAVYVRLRARRARDAGPAVPPPSA